MKKKFVIIALAGVLAVSLAGCGSSRGEDLTLDEQYDEVMRIKAELDAEDEASEEKEEEMEELEEERLEEREEAEEAVEAAEEE